VKTDVRPPPPAPRACGLRRRRWCRSRPRERRSPWWRCSRPPRALGRSRRQWAAHRRRASERRADVPAGGRL